MYRTYLQQVVVFSKTQSTLVGRGRQFFKLKKYLYTFTAISVTHKLEFLIN